MGGGATTTTTEGNAAARSDPAAAPGTGTGVKKKRVGFLFRSVLATEKTAQQPTFFLFFSVFLVDKPGDDATDFSR